jgi:iduronate 2-sulfatase
MWCKHSNYEQAAHIPLIVRVPGKESGEAQGMVETVDIYPTLAELAGIKITEELDGRSFVKAIDEPSTVLRDHVIHVFPRGQILGRAIRTDRYRLVEWKKMGADESKAEWELYDYQEDPLEKRNLFGEAEQEIVAGLKQKLQTHPAPLPQIK